MKLTFDKKECTRCQGTGKHSFNLIHRDMCYGCNGTGKRLSPKGAKARKAFDAVMQMLVSDLIVGDVVMVPSITGKSKQTIHDIKPDAFNEGMIELVFANNHSYHLGSTAWVTLGLAPQYFHRVLAAFEGVEGVTIT